MEQLTQAIIDGRQNFLGIVRHMRDAQKQYFATRTEKAKQDAKFYEECVDTEILKGDTALGQRTEYADRLYFFGLVKSMREHQKRYFATRSTEAQKAAMKYEKFVDEEIKAGDSWLQAQMQPQLFN